MAVTSEIIIGILSAILMVSAFGILILIGYVISAIKGIDTLISSNYIWIPAGVIIGVGAVILFTSICGFGSACCKNRCCSVLFFISLAAILALLITGVVLSFQYKDQIDPIVDKQATADVENYGQPGQNSTTTQVDTAQQYFKCCGTTNYTSWNNTQFGHDYPNHVPISCCVNTKACFDGDLSQMKGKESDFIFTNGCIEEVEKYFKKYLHYMAVGTLCFLIFLVVSLVGGAFKCRCFCVCKKNI